MRSAWPPRRRSSSRVGSPPAKTSGRLASAAQAPCVDRLLGGADPAAFAGATTRAELMARVAAQPSNHSPLYAPVVEPTLSTGIAALVAAARHWLPVGR